MTAPFGRLTAAAQTLGLGLGLVGVCAAVGGLAGYDPRFGIAAALALAFVLVAVANLAVGVAVFATLTFVELAPIAGGVFSLAKLAGLTISISWIAAVASERRRGRPFFTAHPAMTTAFVFFVAWTILSGTWAEESGATWTSVSRYALNIALFPIVYTALREPRHLRWVAGCVIGGAVIAAGYGLISIPSAAEAATSVTAAGDLNRITGTVGDPNLLASVLVVGLVMSLVLALDQSRTIAVRATCAGAALLCLAAIFATVSRGGIVALIAALGAAVVLGGPRRGRMALAATLLVVASVGYFLFFASTAQTDRLVNADGGTGRTDIWRVGWRMVEAHPIEGVGAGNFPISSVHYLLIDPGAIARSEFIVDTPAVAHNLYLEVLAELGVVGLVMFLVIAAGGVLAAIRAARIFDRAGEDGLSLIARGVAVGTISMLAADFFLAAEYSKLLWLLLALGPAALALARRTEPSSAAAT